MTELGKIRVLKVVTTDENKVPCFDDNIFKPELVVSRPALWSLETPVLYQVVSKVYEGNILGSDEYTNIFLVFVIIEYHSQGLFLKWKENFIQICMCNHSMISAPLGGAVNDVHGLSSDSYFERGCNAIRSLHNMPAPS